MNYYFYLVIILQVILYVSSLPSEDLWNKTLQYISEGKMKTFGKNYFIFDEENYTALGIDSTDMNFLYDRQKYLYNYYSLRSFLFICKKLDRSIEDPYSIRNNIRDHLINYGVKINETVFVLISVETIESILYTGNLIKQFYISDNDAVILNNEIKENIKNKEYYEALEDFLIDIEYYIIFKYFNFTNPGKKSNYTYGQPGITPPRYSHKIDYLSKILEVLLPLLFILSLGASIAGCCYCKLKKKCCFKYDNSSNNNYNDSDNYNYNYNNNNDRNSNYSVGSYGGGDNNNSIGGNSNNAPSYGNNSIGRASGGAI